jgi:hypothetical protein
VPQTPRTSQLDQVKATNIAEMHADRFDTSSRGGALEAIPLSPEDSSASILLKRGDALGVKS